MTIEVKTINHLGIVSGFCNEMKLVETIDSMISQGPGTKISIGTRVKAMILNGLGFSDKALYLTSEFFKNKDLDLLLGKDIKPENLNDDSLGRALDAVYKNNPELIFSTIATKAVEIYNIDTNKRHLDTTTVSVEGDYESSDEDRLIRFGHSKDLRKDLQQLVLSSMTTSDGNIPLMFKALPGNTSDAVHFRETLQEFQKNMTDDKTDLTIIFDAAGYNAQMIKSIYSVYWISRVPNTINEAKDLKNNIKDHQYESIENGYSVYETITNYGGIKHRWILVRSQKAFDRELKTLDKSIKKENEALDQLIKSFACKKFSCKDDAQQEFNKLQKKIKYHVLELAELTESKTFFKKGKPKKDDPFKIEYSLCIKSVENKDYIEQTKKTLGKFILATNKIDLKKNTSQNILLEYKKQSSVESNFRFLKNPLCITNAIFLKNQNRIVALCMIMFLCLLIYAVAERALRKALVSKDQTVKSQVKKDVQNPTMRWIFKKMQDISIVRYYDQGILITKIVNMTDEVVKILTLLGSYCTTMYLIPIKTSS